MNEATSTLTRADPRSRGGTHGKVSAPFENWGLSPLARGNPFNLAVVFVVEGPIPARAGEPAAWRTVVLISKAYPRSRGGTSLRRWTRVACEGLSPLARGNPLGRAISDKRQGPIPARAGEPFTTNQWRTAQRAYPRSRGGTAYSLDAIAAIRGLSPLARGNQVSTPSPSAPVGPIPARAGEPLTDKFASVTTTAYPRSRGGTFGVGQLQSIVEGLSPLARGNRCVGTKSQ